MATHNLNNVLGNRRVIDKRQTLTAATAPITAATYTASQSLATIDAALTAADGTYWTQARLDQTCYSDKIHALRLTTDSAGIS